MNDFDDTGNDFFSQEKKKTARFTVTRLTRFIKELVENDIPFLEVEGELSNYILHSSGHRYFTLKDENSQLKCVMFKWQSERIDFEPKEGMKLLALGNISVYERGGYYQLNVVRLLPLGRGDLLANLEELKKKLLAEGIFDNNRSLPSYPETVGIITSPTGAAVRDIISVIGRRSPYVRVVLRPTLVQGTDAGDDIVKAFYEMNEYSNADVLIVGRGGGSIEDLWCFNEEKVARAIYGSRIPVISAVGHETDVTIADFAADLRAPTPSAAAEIAVKDSLDIADMLEGYKSYLKQNMISLLGNLENRVVGVSKSFSRKSFIQYLIMKSQPVDELTLRLNNSARIYLSEKQMCLERILGKFSALDPKGVLKRGYSLVYTKDKKIVTDSSCLSPNQEVTIELSKGSFEAGVMKVNN